MEKIITFFEGVINELSDEYCDDYMDESIPYSRVCTDRERCVKMIEDYFAEEKGNSQRELVLALYGNFYIKYGMAGRFELENDEDENDGLSSIFGGLSPVDSYLRDVYMNVKTQNDDAWDEILEINKGSVVAKIYKFVKLCHSY